MPVDIDQFETAEALREPPTSKRIIRFLFANAEHAYTRREIADAIDADPETVGTNLTRLKDRGLLRHREPYWAATADRDQAIDTLQAQYDDAFVSELFDLDPEDSETTHEDDIATDATKQGARTSGEADSTSATAEQRHPQHRAAAAEFFERVRDRVADATVDLYLFGSVARDGATPDSDVDILAVIADDADYAAVDDQLLDIAYDIQLEHEVRIEVHSLTASEFAARNDRGDPFVQAVLDSGDAHG